MVCLKCGAENPDGVKFCAGCGAMQEGTVAAPEMPKRAPRAPKSKPVSNLVKLLVAILTLVTLVFGVCHLFVDYVVAGKTTSISKSEDGKTIEKDDTYYFKSMIYTQIEEGTIQEAKEALEETNELMEDTEYKLTGSFGWFQIANILGGIGCILIAGVGVLFLLKDMVPVYDMAFGKFFKGKTALTVMGLGGVAFSVLQLLLTSFTKIRYSQIGEETSSKSVSTLGAHWTVWALLIVSVLFVVYDLGANKRKKK